MRRAASPRAISAALSGGCDDARRFFHGFRDSATSSFALAAVSALSGGRLLAALLEVTPDDVEHEVHLLDMAVQDEFFRLGVTDFTLLMTAVFDVFTSSRNHQLFWRNKINTPIYQLSSS